MSSQLRARSKRLSARFELTPANGLVVVTGSVYLVGQVRSQLVAAQGATTEPLKV